MRCSLAVLILCAAFHADAGQLDNARAERLIWSGQAQEAVNYLIPMFEAGETRAAEHLCLVLALSRHEQALYYCGRALQSSDYPLMIDCVQREMRRKGAMQQNVFCYMSFGYDTLADLLALQALAHWDLGDTKDAASRISIARAAHAPPAWLVQLIDIAIRTPAEQQRQAVYETYLRTPASERPRFNKAYAQIFPKLVEQAESEAATQRRRPYIFAAIFGTLTLLAMAAAYHQRARIAEFLKTRPSATAPQPTPPGYPAPYPSYWQAGYMNRPYQLAAWCWVAVWFLICLPLVLLLAIPAITILGDFSAAGMQSAIANARGFAGGFLGWGRLWFGLLLLSLAGFAVTKIYGRYSLPKPFRPRIRVIRTTLRLVFLAVALISVGTFLSYFSGVAANIYSNPLVKLLIDMLR